MMAPQRIIDTKCFERQTRTDLLDSYTQEASVCHFEVDLKKNEEPLGEKVQTACGATVHPTSSLAGSFPGTKARKELNTDPVYYAQTPLCTPTHPIHTTQCTILPQILPSSCPHQPWEQVHIESSIVLTASYWLPFYKRV